MSTDPSPSSNPSASPVFDPSKPHLMRPKLRPVRGFPAQAQTPDGQTVQMLGLSDARQISEKVVITQPAFTMVLPLLDGVRDLDQVVAEVGRGLTRPILEQLIVQLDDAALIEGPAFEALRKRMHETFDASPTLPPASTAQFADVIIAQAEAAEKSEAEKQALIEAGFKAFFDKWIDETLKQVPDPALDTLPRAVVVPHLDYGRGWMNYAAVYGRLRVADRPDRIIILGTNHFGECTGVCACDKGFESPIGTCHADADVISGLRRRLGDAVFAHRFDHEREHSIELHIPWLQHVFGKDASGAYPKVFAALVHDPAVNNGESYDGSGVALQPFVDALKAVIAELPGRTLIISSADLSHAGPAFGDETPLAGEQGPGADARNRVLQTDREMLNLLIGPNAGEGEHRRKAVADRVSGLMSSMAWQQNPTRWCSVGNLCATMLLAEPAETKLVNYAATMDQEGMTFVSSCAMVMV
ncbi:MAG: AmmeMemoRadiSam system protein B [Planctomycetaceae bacterium]|jgi:AmmeMemoRadiSam system protein B|nr:AmmeMemoRadiSam system protein B [Phycisphaerales bacterium]MCE2652407.1 AmmeMemoRadiSam system protein B [Planctomycetaceae bacterium]